MGEFAGALLGVVGLIIMVAAFVGGGWALWKHARATGRRTYQFLGGALMAIGAYGAVTAVIVAVQRVLP